QRDTTPEAVAPTPDFPAVELSLTPSPAQKPVDVAPAALADLQLIEIEVMPAVAKPTTAPAVVAPTASAALELRLDAVEPVAAQEIDLVAFGAKRAPMPTAAGAASPTPIPALPPGDPLMAEAMREYKDGNIDLPLWAHVIAQHEGDQPAAIAAYLKARTTLLKLERRQRRVDDPKLPVRAAVPLKRVNAQSSDDEDDFVPPRSRSNAMRKYAMFATPVVVALVVGIWWMVAPSDRDSAYAVATPANTGAAASAPAAAAKLPAHATKEVDPGTYFAGKVLDLKAAGNWNVLVLFASEWTRKQPGNATAWKELSSGYSNMRQFNDALEAGTKATQLAPNDPLAWRNLAQVNLDLKEPEAALKAFEHAAVANELDVYSLVQIGTLSVQLDRLPQARAAFDRALLADPDNPDALCGMASIAQRQGRSKDAETAAKSLRGTDRKCREIATTVAVAGRK
ncbi:MAG: tetratricopeptide repeat protein, partial [Betaproteobacteria bacterium]